MKTRESVAASTEVANGMCGMTEDITNRMTPLVLAAAVAGTKTGADGVGRDRPGGQPALELIGEPQHGELGVLVRPVRVVAVLELGVVEVEVDRFPARAGKVQPGTDRHHPRRHGTFEC
jgi:hypothetical protein